MLFSTRSRAVNTGSVYRPLMASLSANRVAVGGTTMTTTLLRVDVYYTDIGYNSLFVG